MKNQSILSFFKKENFNSLLYLNYSFYVGNIWNFINCRHSFRTKKTRVSTMKSFREFCLWEIFF